MKFYNCMLIAIIFVFVIQTSSSCDNIDYCTCLGDVESAKAAYDALFVEFYIAVNETVRRNKPPIDERLDTINHQNPCGLSKDYNSYVEDLVLICGQHVIDKEKFAAPWTNCGKLSKEDVCKWLVVHQPGFCRQSSINTEAMKTCDYLGIFDNTFLQIINACNKKTVCSRG